MEKTNELAEYIFKCLDDFDIDYECYEESDDISYAVYEVLGDFVARISHRYDDPDFVAQEYRFLNCLPLPKSEREKLK